MTASRRQFTFGALMLALSGKAHAGRDAELRQQAQAARPTKLALVPVFVARRVGKELHVDLSIVNKGDPTELIVKWGRGLGPELNAAIAVEGGITELARVFDVERRELFSRVGPRPVFAPLASNHELEIGTYRFTWVAGLPEGQVRITASVETADGPFDFGMHDVSWKRSEA